MSTYYVASDRLGTPRVVADASGAVVKAMEYDSYGFLHSVSNPSFDLPIGFAGGIPDTTGLIRFGFRDYEPGSGRWVSRDRILYKSGQFNLYQYVHNDPINLTDSSGLAPNDKLYGLPDAFWHWYHRNVKKPGDPDITKDEADEYVTEWESLGKPGPDHKRNIRACQIDEITYTNLPDGMGPLIPLLYPSLVTPTITASKITVPVRPLMPRLMW